MGRIYEKFVTAKEDGKGHLVDLEFHPPENYNFAFDVMDALAEKDPDKKP